MERYKVHIAETGRVTACIYKDGDPRGNRDLLVSASSPEEAIKIVIRHVRIEADG